MKWVREVKSRVNGKKKGSEKEENPKCPRGESDESNENEKNSVSGELFLRSAIGLLRPRGLIVPVLPLRRALFPLPLPLPIRIVCLRLL